MSTWPNLLLIAAVVVVYVLCSEQYRDSYDIYEEDNRRLYYLSFLFWPVLLLGVWCAGFVTWTMEAYVGIRYNISLREWEKRRANESLKDSGVQYNEPEPPEPKPADPANVIKEKPLL